MNVGLFVVVKVSQSTYLLLNIVCVLCVLFAFCMYSTLYFQVLTLCSVNFDLMKVVLNTNQKKTKKIFIVYGFGFGFVNENAIYSNEIYSTLYMNLCRFDVLNFTLLLLLLFTLFRSFVCLTINTVYAENLL